jgi:uncharacterized protein (TIGR02677 family)
VAELPADLLIDAIAASGDPPPPPVAPLERLGAHAVLRYAIDDEQDIYRRVMRIMSLEHRAFGLRLRPEQVADRLRERYGREVDREWLEQRLSALVGWGALERDHDAGLASSAAEWRRNRFVYDITAAGQLTEELLERLDALGEQHGRLEGDRLPAILDALRRLAHALEAASPDGAALRTLLEQVFGQVGQLHEAALAFMRSLGALIRRAEQVDEREFEASKGALLDHLQGFRQDRRRWSADVLEAIDAVEAAGAARMVATIVDAEEFVALPGGATVEAQRAHRQRELTERWRGVGAWFVGDGARDSPWKALDDHVLDAIRAVVGIAERLIERRSQRVDRVHVLLALAARAAQAPPDEAVAWVRAALAVRSPRHVGVPEEDAAQVADRGRTSWGEAPPAPVVAYLRRPGATAPGRGRGARVLDLDAGRRRVLEQRARERAELDELLRRFASRGRVRLSALERVDEREFVHVLRWIGRAYESPAAADGTRNALSIDGRAAIVLRAPADPLRERTILRAPHGRLDVPDYALEVRARQASASARTTGETA